MQPEMTDIDPLRDDLARAFADLPVFRLPVELALYTIIAAAEARLFRVKRLTTDSYQLSHFAWLQKLGLTRLVPEILRRCTPQRTLWNSSDSLLLSQAHMTAAEAIEFSVRYDWAQHYLFLARQGYFNVHRKGHEYDFSYANPTEARYIWFEGKLGDSEKRDRSSDPSLRDAYDRIGRMLLLLKPAVSIGARPTAVHKLSAHIYADVLEIESAVCRPSDLPGNLLVGTYSLAEARDMWISLRALASSTAMATSTLLDRSESVTVEDFLPFQFEKPGLSDLVSRFTGVTPNKANDFISNVTLEPSAKRPDLQLTPLIPIFGSNLTFSPLVLGSVEWETCTLRRLSISDGGIFSGTIGAKKKALAGRIAEMLKQKGFEVNRTVTIFDKQANPRGDVDVAVYDRTTNHLALMEVKWFIPSDSAHELFSNDCKIVEERQKFERFLDYLLGDLGRCWKFIFPSFTPDLAGMKISTYMICRGSVGRLPLDGPVPIFDYDIAVREIEKSRGTLAGLWSDILRQHEAYIDPDPPVSALRLAGHCLRLPAKILEEEHGQVLYDLNKESRRCSCGSGGRFEDCCSLVS